jgi:cation:H+ antiporter
MARHKIDEDSDEVYMSLGKAFLFTIGGIVAIVLGSNFVVDSASKIASMLGVSEKMISLTIIALGTSLPELVTSVTATRKGEYDIAIGNVVGSNIFNIGLVIGIPVAIFGGVNNLSFNAIDLCVLLGSAMLLFFYSFNDRKISKGEGLSFLGIFIIYYTYVIMMG